MNHRIAASLLLLFVVFTGVAQDKPVALKRGAPVQRQLRGGETHRYLIKLKSGEFVHAVIEQQGIDVVVGVFAPGGAKLAEMNNRDLDYGQEPLSFISKSTGEYLLSVSARTASAPAGSYTIRVVDVHSPKAIDNLQIEAERESAEGQRLRLLEKAESYPTALEHYGVALEKWQELGDRYWEANTRANIGIVHSLLDENDKAIQAFSTALPIAKTVGDVDEESRILNNLGVVYQSLGEHQKALDYYQQALPLARAVGDRRSQARTIFNLGRLHAFISDYQHGIDYLGQALTLWRELGNREAEVATQSSICLAHNLLGQNQQALDCYDLVLPIQRSLKDTSGEAFTLVSIGNVYKDLGDLQRALQYYNEALPLRRANGDVAGEASILIDVGSTYRRLGKAANAIEHFNRAAQLAHQANDSSGEGFALINLGMIYAYDLSSKDQAVDYYNQALNLRRMAKDRTGEASVLVSLGGIYRLFGDVRKALEYHTQALPLTRGPLEDRGKVANLIIDIGSDYYSLNQKEKALDFYNQALQIGRGNRRYEALALVKIGLVYGDLGEKQKALDAYNQALRLNQETGDRAGEASVLRWMGDIYLDLGEKRKALETYQLALVARRMAGDRRGEALTLVSLMNSSATGVAQQIFYGKQAINIYQEVRNDIQGLDQEAQQNFLHAVEVWYRRLADLLISSGRLPEAQQVLGLLKKEEYFEFVRRDSNEASSVKAPAELTETEASLANRYREIADRVTAIGVEYGHLRDKQNRTTDEEQRLVSLQADLTVANQVFQKFLDKIDEAFSNSPVRSEKPFQLRESQGLMETLRELGEGAVALYTVVGEDKYRVILVTPDVQKAYEYPITAADLNRRVLQFREAVQNPNIDPRPLANELYKILIGPELARDLEQARAQTLMWSLDGVLRYLPIAALNDGNEYLVQRYRNVVFTPASQSRLKDSVSGNWKALGLGVSKAQPGFNALPGVPTELRGIIGEDGQAVLKGQVILDEAFTSSAMQTALRQHYPLVHIASHFQFRPGNETDSFLLLGDGTHLTLAQIKSLPNIFSGVDLLTLSACDTANGGSGANGKEVEGFGVLAQRQGAKAVLATLWPVADDSTQTLMREFYRLHEANPQSPKAEALRQAQLTLLKGTDQEPAVKTSAQRSRVVGVSGGSSAAGVPFTPNANARYSHPYYWAPFILIGNWR